MMLDEIEIKKRLCPWPCRGAALGVTSLLVAGARRGAVGARWDAARARHRAGGASGAGRETNSQRETNEIPPGAAHGGMGRTRGTRGRWGGGVGDLSSAKNPRETAAGRTREVLRLVVVLKTRFVLFFLPQLRLKMRVITHFKKRGRCLQPRSVNGASPPPQPPGAPPGHRPRSSPPLPSPRQPAPARGPRSQKIPGGTGKLPAFHIRCVFFFLSFSSPNSL